MSDPARFPAPLSMLPLRLLSEVAPFTMTTWHEIDRLELTTLGELSSLERRLSAQTEEDLDMLAQWLRESGALPLRVFLPRWLLNLIVQAIGPMPSGPSATALQHLLDDPLVFALQALQLPPSQIRRALRRWADRFHRNKDVHEEPVSILAELQGQLPPKVARDREVLIAFRGFATRESMTLGELGVEYGVSAGRIGMLAARDQDILTSLPIPSPLLLQAYRILVEAAEPLPLATWHARIPVAFRPRNQWELRVLHRLHEWTSRMPVAWLEHEGVEWVAATGESAASIRRRLAHVIPAIREPLRQFALVPSLEPVAEDDRDLARQYLSAHPDRFIRAPGGWWLSRPDQEHDGAELPRHILGTLGELSVAELRGGLRRMHTALPEDTRGRMRVPSLERMPGVLTAAGFEVTPTGMVRLGSRTPGRAPEPRTGGLLALFRAHPRELAWNEIMGLVEMHGMDRARIGYLLRWSPLIRRTGRGRYVLRGSEIAVGRDIDLRPPQAPPELLVESREGSAGQIIMAWKLVAGSKYGRYPLGSVRPPEGEYHLTMRGRKWRVQVVGESIRGLQRLATHLQRAGHKQMRIKIKPGKHEIIPIVTDLARAYLGYWSDQREARLTLPVLEPPR